MASLPSKMLFGGVERVVITCQPDSTLTGAEAQAICAQLVKKAQNSTRLPVSAAKAADLHEVPSGEQIVLHVALSTGGLQADRGTLAMTITPSRNLLNFDKGAPIKSEAQLARIQGQLVVQGPVTAFDKILGAMPPKLSRPERSDS